MYPMSQESTPRPDAAEASAKKPPTTAKTPQWGNFICSTFGVMRGTGSRVMRSDSTPLMLRTAMVALPLLALVGYMRLLSITKYILLSATVCLGLCLEEIWVIQSAQTWTKFFVQGYSSSGRCGPRSHDVDWLNSVIWEMWPSFSKWLSAVLAAAIPAAINGVLAATPQEGADPQRPGGLRVGFDEFDLGNDPPRVLELFDFASETARVTLDVSFRLKCAGTAAMSIFQNNWCLGVVKISGIHVEGRIRAILGHFLPQPPYVGHVRVSFAHRPSVNFDFEAFRWSLGITSLVQSIVRENILDSFVFPNEIPISLFSEKELFHFYKKRAEDLLSVEPQGYIKISLLRARGLVRKDVLGRSDPYVIFSVGGSERAESPVRWCTLDPEWNLTYRLKVLDTDLQQLEVAVLDKDVGLDDDDFIGSVSIPLAPFGHPGPDGLPLCTRQEYDLRLVDSVENRGKIELDLEWFPLVEAEPTFEDPLPDTEESLVEGSHMQAETATDDVSPRGSEGSNPGGASNFVCGSSTDLIGGVIAPAASESRSASSSEISKTTPSATPETAIPPRGFPLSEAAAPLSLSSQQPIEGFLTLEVRSARNLPAADVNGFSDPFVEFKLLWPMEASALLDPPSVDLLRKVDKAHTKRTRKITKSLSPVWNEVVDIPIHDAMKSLIYVQVIDHDMLTTNDKLGWFQVPTAALLPASSWNAELASLYSNSAELLPSCKGVDAAGYPYLWSLTPSDRWDVSSAEINIRFKFRRCSV